MTYVKRFEKLFCWVVILFSVIFLISNVAAVSSSYTQKFLLKEDYTEIVEKELLILSSKFEIDTVKLNLPKESYIRGRFIYVPAKSKFLLLPVLNVLEEIRIGDYTSDDIVLIKFKDNEE